MRTDNPRVEKTLLKIYDKNPLHLLHNGVLGNRPNHNKNWKYSGCLNKLNVASESNHQNLYLIGCLEQCDKMKKFWIGKR